LLLFYFSRFYSIQPFHWYFYYNLSISILLFSTKINLRRVLYFFFAIYHGSEKNAWILQVNYCETKYFANIFIAILPVKNKIRYRKLEGLHRRINSGLSKVFSQFSVAIYFRARLCWREKFSPDFISDTRGRSSIENRCADR